MGNNLNNIDQLSVDRRKSSIAQLNETQSQIDLYSNNLSFINEAQCIASKNSLDDFTIDSVIGSGAFSTVYLVRDKVCNQEFALKSIPKRNIIERTI